MNPGGPEQGRLLPPSLSGPEKIPLNIAINRFHGGTIFIDILIPRISAESESCAVPHTKRNNGAVFAFLLPVGLETGKGRSPGVVRQSWKPVLLPASRSDIDQGAVRSCIIF